MKPNFIFIHSTSGYPDECWYPWLREEIKKLGCKVTVPRFPTPHGQSLDSWMKVFEPYFKQIDENTILLGRSVGVPFILRILERVKKPVKAAFFVAGFCSDLDIPEFTPLLNSFIDKPFVWEKIRINCKKFFVYHGDDDIIVPLSYGKELADKVGANIRVIKEGGHFNLNTRFAEKFEEIFEEIKKEL